MGQAKAFLAKVYRTSYDLLVAICDKELFGKKLGQSLRIKVGDFYNEREIDEKEAIKLLRKAGMGNLLGKRIIELALKEGLIDKENILMIGDIPHAQFIKL